MLPRQGQIKIKPKRESFYAQNPEFKPSEFMKTPTESALSKK